VTSSCEHGNEPMGSITGGEFLDHLSDYQLPKKDSAPWKWFVMYLWQGVRRELPGSKELPLQMLDD
jgi:hypothetical protein